MIPIGLLAAGGLAAGTGLAQAIQGGRKTEFDKENEALLDELTGLRKQGALGLTEQERQLSTRSQLDPVRALASAAQSQQAAIQAASGNTSGASLAALREQQQRQVGGAAQQAALNVEAADLEARRAQEAEIAQRQAVAEQRRQDRVNNIFSGISQAAGAAGAVAGAIPEVGRIAGIAGAPIRDTGVLEQRLSELGAGPAATQAILRIPPDRLTTVLDNIVQGNLEGDLERSLLAALDLDRQG